MCGRASHHSHWRRKQAKRWWKHKFASMWHQPAVNVKEYDHQYELLVYASGYAKSDFQVSIRDHTLIIKAKHRDVAEGENWHWRRQEFQAQGFERQFELNEKVDRDAIEAKYEEGILVIKLPKLEGFETSRQDIDIS